MSDAVSAAACLIRDEREGFRSVVYHRSYASEQEERGSARTSQIIGDAGDGALQSAGAGHIPDCNVDGAQWLQVVGGCRVSAGLLTAVQMFQKEAHWHCDQDFTFTGNLLQLFIYTTLILLLFRTCFFKISRASTA